MDINALLKKGECSCGRNHSCNIENVYIEHDALARFEELCKNYSCILLVADENTYAAAGEKTEKALRGKQIKKVIFSGKSPVIPNEAAIEKAEKDIDGVDLIIGIGSGVMQDLCKYISYDKKIPYMVAATAPSMDGYASGGAAMILKGMKISIQAGVPRAIVADTEVLKNAPMDMIIAGYGDIIGKFSALNDWKLSKVINDEYFCEYIYNLAYDMAKTTLSLADGILNRDEESVGVLMEALVVVGVLMSFVGSSRPASGGEHHLSHFFEITGIVNGEEHLPHGIDVAFSMYIMAKLKEKILFKAFPEKLHRENESEYRENMQRIYKSVAEECIKLQQKVGNYACNRMDIYKEKEQEIKDVLSEMPPAEKVLKMLEHVGLDINDFYNMYGEEKIKDAVKYAKDLKDRYTVLWLNYDLFEGEI